MLCKGIALCCLLPNCAQAKVSSKKRAGGQRYACHKQFGQLSEKAFLSVLQSVFCVWLFIKPFAAQVMWEPTEENVTNIQLTILRLCK